MVIGSSLCTAIKKPSMANPTTRLMSSSYCSVAVGYLNSTRQSPLFHEEIHHSSVSTRLSRGLDCSDVDRSCLFVEGAGDNDFRRRELRRSFLVVELIGLLGRRIE